MKEIWFAGGCFWGTEKLFQSIKGVLSTETGYANGNPDVIPNYRRVCEENTGYKETVHVTYDPDQVSLDYLVYSFYLSIDPTLKNRQGNDYGTQYQAGIFWSDTDSENTVRRISQIESERYHPFNVLLEKLTSFVPAEDYHQKYLDKNEQGYCHVDPTLFKMVSRKRFDPSKYFRPTPESIASSLTSEEYEITQNGGTERPFENEYNDNREKGIYVDKVTGEPLFLSSDKYDSSCGWPAFCRPLDPTVVRYLEDNSHGMNRIEVRSRVGNTHLGHVFVEEADSPTTVRYCINSASLRFIPFDQMAEKGYGFLCNLHFR